MGQYKHNENYPYKSTDINFEFKLSSTLLLIKYFPYHMDMFVCNLASFGCIFQFTSLIPLPVSCKRLILTTLIKAVFLVKISYFLF